MEHMYYRNPPSETYILNYYQNTWMKNYRKANKKLFTLPSKGISYKISEILVDFNYSNHVVEHIHNPTEFFKWATTRVNENGLIIINVPDADYETAQDTLLYLPHLHSFTAKSLECLGRQHDYQLLLWIKGDHNELCGIFYTHLTVNLDKNKFLTVMQKQR